jgi:hypothetical protein
MYCLLAFPCLLVMLARCMSKFYYILQHYKLIFLILQHCCTCSPCLHAKLLPYFLFYMHHASALTSSYIICNALWRSMPLFCWCIWQCWLFNEHGMNGMNGNIYIYIRVGFVYAMNMKYSWGRVKQVQ